MGERSEPVAGKRVTLCVTGLRGIPEVMGGVESHCEELLPRIKALWPEHHPVVLGRAPYLPAGPIRYRGVEVAGVPCPRSKHFEALVSTFLAVIEARRRGADLLHIHAIGPGLMAPFARAMGLRVVVTHHGTDYDRAKWGPVAKLALRAGEWLALRFAHRVIAVSPSLADTLRASFPGRADRIRYIPNGAPELPDGENADAVLDRLGITGPFLLAVGRLVPEKGLHDLVAAFERSGIPGQLVIVGAADHHSDYARTLTEKAGQRVIFAGLQSRATLKCLYQRCARFVMPSYHEGLPIAALEAGSCGAPMLLSDIPANRDIALDPRNYFPVGDVARLAACLAEPHERFAVDASAVRARFSWDAAARDTLQVYRSVLRREAAPVAILRPGPADR